jgi:hypothetical protein
MAIKEEFKKIALIRLKSAEILFKKNRIGVEQDILWALLLSVL